MGCVGVCVCVCCRGVFVSECVRTSFMCLRVIERVRLCVAGCLRVRVCAYVCGYARCASCAWVCFETSEADFFGR